MLIEDGILRLNTWKKIHEFLSLMNSCIVKNILMMQESLEIIFLKAFWYLTQKKKD